MKDQRSSRRDQVAFWLGMASLLFALCPLATVAFARNADAMIPFSSLLTSPPAAWLAIARFAFVIAPAAGIVVGVVSLLVRINWRGGAAVAIGACSLLALVALGLILADAPDR